MIDPSSRRRAHLYALLGYAASAVRPLAPRIAWNQWVFRHVIWTLTSHGQTNRGYGTLDPGYVIDEFLIMHEFGNSLPGRKQPTLQVEGQKQTSLRDPPRDEIASLKPGYTRSWPGDPARRARRIRTCIRFNVGNPPRLGAARGKREDEEQERSR